RQRLGGDRGPGGRRAGGGPGHTAAARRHDGAAQRGPARRGRLTMSDLFITRTRFAMVISIVISIAGALSLLVLPVQQYPNITPPTVSVSASYPGASAEVIADVVGGPLETAINGVDNMMYMSSTSSNAGQYSLAITFAVGTDPDMAQVNVQNRAQLALSRSEEHTSELQS